MKPGDLCEVQFPFTVMGIDAEGQTITYGLTAGEAFILIDFIEIDELGVIEFEILFENKKMWFNAHQTDCNIEYVRRAKSYDIPFMTLQEASQDQTLPPWSNIIPHTN